MNEELKMLFTVACVNNFQAMTAMNASKGEQKKLYEGQAHAYRDIATIIKRYLDEGVKLDVCKE